jgi:hypothetical protein
LRLVRADGVKPTALTAMFVGLFDHLWQTIGVSGCAAALAFIARHCFAALRLWLWRIAAIKFVIPFALPFAIGQWMGLRVAHTADPVPTSLVQAAAVVTPIVSPAHFQEWTGTTLLIALPLALIGAAACARVVRRRLRLEWQRAEKEKARRAIDVDAIEPRPGFLHSALLTVCAMGLISIPLLGGAVDDRQRRLGRLTANSLAFRNATLRLSPAAPGLGWRYRVDVDAHGVSIRNVNIRQLVALVYGINYYRVYSDQMNSEADPKTNSWLLTPLYDLRATATIPELRDFDPYALHQSVTKLLAERFGLQLEMNGNCQPPCGVYGVPMSEDPL